MHPRIIAARVTGPFRVALDKALGTIASTVPIPA